ncbi:MAG: GNAT family N-acetyltransferase, partial [Candidatus Omnitrophica bacterium]|nr:GNAT family N-acetyltransferase [Candidatus Omnitrophota bacterium]
MGEIKYKVIDSINEIPQAEWERLFPDTIEGYPFYKTVEEAHLEGFSFHYLLLYEKGALSLIAPLFITEFDLAIAAEGLPERIISCLRRFMPKFLKLQTLFCGSPFGENGKLGIKKDSRDHNILIQALAKGIDDFSEEKKISLAIFKDFPKENLPFLNPLEGMGFWKIESFPSIITELPFTSFKEYLESLGHETRKGLRRKLKKAHAKGDIKVEIKNSAEGLIEDIYRLYLNTYTSGDTKLERLTPEFFLSAGKNMQPNTRFFLYYVNGGLAAFNLCFVYENLFIDKFIGFDYDISRKYNLYFLSWCFNVEWCIKNSVTRYQTGQTDYQPTMQL